MASIEMLRKLTAEAVGTCTDESLLDFVWRLLLNEADTPPRPAGSNVVQLFDGMEVAA